MAYWVTRTDGVENRLPGGYWSEMRKVRGPFNDYHQAELAAQPYRQQEADRVGRDVSAWLTFRYVYSVMSDEQLATASGFGTRIT